MPSLDAPPPARRQPAEDEIGQAPAEHQGRRPRSPTDASAAIRRATGARRGRARPARRSPKAPQTLLATRVARPPCRLIPALARTPSNRCCSRSADDRARRDRGAEPVVPARCSGRAAGSGGGAAAAEGFEPGLQAFALGDAPQMESGDESHRECESDDQGLERTAARPGRRGRSDRSAAAGRASAGMAIAAPA